MNTPCIDLMQGVLFMCRRNQLLGWILIAFALGLLTGLRLESDFICNCVGFCVAAFGVTMFGKK